MSKSVRSMLDRFVALSRMSGRSSLLVEWWLVPLALVKGVEIWSISDWL